MALAKELFLNRMLGTLWHYNEVGSFMTFIQHSSESKRIIFSNGIALGSPIPNEYFREIAKQNVYLED